MQDVWRDFFHELLNNAYRRIVHKTEVLLLVSLFLVSFKVACTQSQSLDSINYLLMHAPQSPGSSCSCWRLSPTLNHSNPILVADRNSTLFRFWRAIKKKLTKLGICNSYIEQGQFIKRIPHSLGMEKPPKNYITKLIAWRQTLSKRGLTPPPTPSMLDFFWTVLKRWQPAACWAETPIPLPWPKFS